MKILFSIILIVFSSCSFNFVGVVTLKSYKIRHNPKLVEKALIDVQYKYPEVRYTAHSQSSIVERFDISYENKEKGVLTKEDSIWLSTPLKDYYRHWNGYKVFVLSSLDKKFLYEIRLLNEDENKCLLGVVFSSLKNEDGYIGISEPKHYLRDSAIVVFEADILPKINNLLEIQK